VAVIVRNEVDFFTSLTNSSITELRVVSDIRLLPSTWEQLPQPFLVTRNVTVTGWDPNRNASASATSGSLQPSQTSFYPLINFNLVTAKLKLAPGVRLTLKSFISSRIRTVPLDSGFDILMISPNSTVLTVDYVRRYEACLPPYIAVAPINNLSRPVPGRNNASITAGGFCRDAPLPKLCWGMPNASSVAVTMTSFADHLQEYSEDSAADRTLKASFLYLVSDSWYVCDHQESLDCIKELGIRNCALTTTNRIRLEEDAAEHTPPPSLLAQPSPDDSHEGGKSPVPAYAIAVPVAVGGTCVIAISTLAAVLIWRRLHAGSSTYAGSSKGAPASAGSHSPPANQLSHQLSHAAMAAASSVSGALPTTASNAASLSGLYKSGSGNVLGHASFPTSNNQLPTVMVSQDTIGSNNGSLMRPNQLLLAGVSGVAASLIPSSAVITHDTPAGPECDLGITLSDIHFTENVLGRGGFGVVVQGVFRGRPAAIKLVPDSNGLKEKELADFRSEVEILAKLSHPNVVALYAACLTPPNMCLVLELCETNLEALIHRTNITMPLSQVLSIANEIACGLAYLHPTVVHRDIKPANILMGSDGRVKIADFGIARLRAATTVVTEHPEAGTIAYMAPECFDPDVKSLHHRADIWSWAVIVWEMLTGEKPYQGQRSLVIAYNTLLAGKRLEIPADETRCPARLRRLLGLCWDKDPQKRPAAAELVKEMQLLQQGLASSSSSMCHVTLPPGTASPGASGTKPVTTLLWVGIVSS